MSADNHVIVRFVKPSLDSPTSSVLQETFEVGLVYTAFVSCEIVIFEKRPEEAVVLLEAGTRVI